MEINGRTIAKEILSDLAIRVQKLKEKGLPAGRQGITPTLVIILVGDNPQSIAYIEQKELKAIKIGAVTKVIKLNSDVSQAELLKTIEQLNDDSNVHGIIIQRPLPTQINSEEIDNAVTPEKDVDGFNPKSRFEPPLGEAIIAILKSVDKNFRDNKIVLIGKGETGGKPVVETFEKENIPYWVLDTKTTNKDELTKQADIIISAVGKKNMVKPENIRKGVILISVGLFKGPDGKMHGDYDEDEIKDIASFYTPTPGGVGPVNVACLLKNLVTAAESQ